MLLPEPDADTAAAHEDKSANEYNYSNTYAFTVLVT